MSTGASSLHEGYFGTDGVGAVAGDDGDQGRLRAWWTSLAMKEKARLKHSKSASQYCRLSGGVERTWHTLPNILFLTLCAVMGGMYDWTRHTRKGN